MRVVTPTGAAPSTCPQEQTQVRRVSCSTNVPLVRDGVLGVQPVVA
jgi:hypothetical protein